MDANLLDLHFDTERAQIKTCECCVTFPAPEWSFPAANSSCQVEDKARISHPLSSSSSSNEVDPVHTALRNASLGVGWLDGQRLTSNFPTFPCTFKLEAITGAHSLEQKDHFERSSGELRQDRDITAGRYRRKAARGAPFKVTSASLHGRHQDYLTSLLTVTICHPNER